MGISSQIITLCILNNHHAQFAQGTKNATPAVTPPATAGAFACCRSDLFHCL